MKDPKCPDCGGKGHRPYEYKSSTAPWISRASSLPCQTCNLEAFGLSPEQIAEIKAERASA